MVRPLTPTGSLTSETTLTLDEPIRTGPGRYRVTVERIDSEPGKVPLAAFLSGLRARQAARGHVPRSSAEIAAQVEAERASWDV